jgi:hypothetical protein
VGLAVVVVVMGGWGMGIDVVVGMDATSIVVRTVIADMIIVVWGGTG